jgi:hypothetical protein
MTIEKRAAHDDADRRPERPGNRKASERLKSLKFRD